MENHIIKRTLLTALVICEVVRNTARGQFRPLIIIELREMPVRLMLTDPSLPRLTDPKRDYVTLRLLLMYTITHVFVLLSLIGQSATDD